jgi:hypothetical protein
MQQLTGARRGSIETRYLPFNSHFSSNQSIHEIEVSMVTPGTMFSGSLSDSLHPPAVFTFSSHSTVASRTLSTAPPQPPTAQGNANTHYLSKRNTKNSQRSIMEQSCVISTDSMRKKRMRDGVCIINASKTPNWWVYLPISL